MTAATDPVDRAAPARRPAGTPAGYQRWSDLLFVHWRMPPQEIAAHLPSRLTVDTFQGSAWVGLIPFRMSGVRPWWSPPVPGVSSFCETNVRTYVHLDGRDPGVWFFTLDASSSLAVRIARRRWRLNYFRAAMSVEALDGTIRYRSRRLWPGPPGPGAQIEAELGVPLGGGNAGELSRQAGPGTLAHFLAERYVLYTQGPRGGLHRGRVHHRPYPLREARLVHMEESLLQAAGLAPAQGPEHTIFSEGVSVSVYPLERV